MRNFLLHWAPMIGYCATIYALSSIPGGKVALELFEGADKLIHAIEYGLLGLLTARALGNGTPWRLTRAEAVTGAALFCLAFGALDEIHQSYVPGRFSDFMDLFADVGGGTLAAAVYGRFAVGAPDGPTTVAA